MPAGIPLGPYLLLRRLATGGMAEIFLARKEGPEGFARDLVVKRILPHLAENPQFADLFLEEARIAARLTHPNVVQVYDFGQADGSWYLAMELVRGVDLAGLVRRRAETVGGGLPAHHAAKILSFVCEGLAHAHGLTVDGRAAGLVHRDVTPSNVLISFDGAVKVADFGIAKLAVGGQRQDLTQHGRVRGKYAYLSPEQARGKPLDARSDIFNCGILLFEALAGQWLFPHTDPLRAKTLCAAGEIPQPERMDVFPRALRRVVRRALRLDPGARYPDALSMRADLEAFLRKWHEPSDTVELGAFVREVCPDVFEHDRRAPRAAGTVPATVMVDGSEPMSSRPPSAQVPATGLLEAHPPFGGSGATSTASVPTEVDGPLAPQEFFAPPRPDPSATPLSTTATTSTGRRAGRPSVALRFAGAAAVVALGVIVGFVAWGAGSDDAPTAPATSPPAAPPPADPPEVAAPAPPATGEVEVVVDPPGELWVDGERHGATPSTLHVSSGVAHRLELRRGGRVVATEIVTIAPGERHRTDLRAPPPQDARVSAVSTPNGARVLVDGEEIGRTPFEEVAVAPGVRTLRAELDGYAADERLVTLPAGGVRALVFQLERERAAPVGGAGAAGHGYLNLATTPWSKVYLGRRYIGTTPLANVRLPAGRQTLTLRPLGTGAGVRRTVVIRANERVAQRFSL